jgi:hypothetical protein
LITNKNNKNYNGSINRILLLEENEIRLMEIEKQYKNKQKELKEYEEQEKNKKIKYLMEQRIKEKALIQKRKKASEEMMVDIKNKVEPSPKEEECLFYKMEQNYQDNEKKLLNKITAERKVKNIFYKQNANLENIKNDFQNYQNQLHQRAIEQTNNMKNLWHSRSMIMKKYETKMMRTLKENEELEAKNEQIMKITKKGLFLEKELYGKKKIQLPPIDEKLKLQSMKNQIDIKTLKGKDRVNYVKEKYDQRSFKLKNAKKELDFGKKYVINKVKKRKAPTNGNNAPKKIFNSMSYDKCQMANLINDYNKININKNKDINNMNIKDKINLIYNTNNALYDKNIQYLNNNIANKLASSADKIRIKKNPKEINYLNELKQKNQSKYHKWNKYIKSNNSQNIDLEGVQNINKKVESLDEKVNMGNELIKNNGGYENNLDIGIQLNNMLIDSINGKLEVIKELYNEKDNKKNNMK